MEVSVNNEALQVSEGSTLASVVALKIGDKTKGVAVAVNETVVPKDCWNDHVLHPKDNVLLIKATQGG